MAVLGEILADEGALRFADSTLNDCLVKRQENLWSRAVFCVESLNKICCLKLGLRIGTAALWMGREFVPKTLMI